MEAETFKPPNSLAKARNGNGPVTMDQNVLKRAEHAVEALREEYSGWAQKDVDALRLAVDAARADPDNAATPIADIYKHALDMKGQGGGFGYAIITDIGELLTKFMVRKTRLSPRDFRIVDAHVDAIQVVVRDKIKGDGGPVGIKIVDGLRRIVLAAED